jgi:hypothetical protein
MLKNSNQEGIKACYLLFMWRYHRDVNPLQLAHARAAQADEAFHCLPDFYLGAWHDAQLVQRRRAAVPTRAVSPSRSARRRALVARGGQPLLRCNAT